MHVHAGLMRSVWYDRWDLPCDSIRIYILNTLYESCGNKGNAIFFTLCGFPELLRQDYMLFYTLLKYRVLWRFIKPLKVTIDIDIFNVPFRFSVNLHVFVPNVLTALYFPSTCDHIIPVQTFLSGRRCESCWWGSSSGRLVNIKLCGCFLKLRNHGNRIG